ncbi:MAG: YdeI/OmpD-associated family protein, partial [Phycisphaerae bacterium]|nr:YdeI/OmpD-associated family protein [Phycisphaerae bacterium]NIP55201.1 YdeI/OmpD-associated family protein [Phycisphaerae bacterium]NIX01574.1 hypothetical protein [Phycisphaerae bacterium]NIX31374.1 hypothetical protein [Phycisphaerae bacterium]
MKQGLLHPSVLPAAREVLRGRFVFPADIIEAVKANPQAWEHYRRFSPAYKRIRVAYIEAARGRPGEFRKRLAHFIEKT